MIHRLSGRSDRGASLIEFAFVAPTRQLPERERGATLVEAAIVLPIAILMIMAIAEFSLAFKDWLTIAHASREGGRAAATYGDDPRADILILNAIGANLIGANLDSLKDVEIGNPQTGISTTYSYTPGPFCDWTPCPDPDVGLPLYTPPNWLPSSRDVSAPTTDRITVRMEYTHQWVTGFFNDTSDFTTEITMRIEPQVFG